MTRGNVTKSLAAAAVGFFVANAATAQEVKNLPPGATAHFIYFPTGGYALDAKDEAQVKDVAAMMQSNPDFVGTILGKTQFRWLHGIQRTPITKTRQRSIRSFGV